MCRLLHITKGWHKFHIHHTPVKGALQFNKTG